MSSGEKAAKSKAKAPSKTKSSKGKEVSFNDHRFRGDGVKFKCKLVGSADVSSARGDAMCAEAIKKLKVQALKLHKESGEHKQKIIMYITLKGIRIVDEKTQKLQYEHPINKISFITHDPEDKRTFGFICSQPCTTGHKLYAIKSDKPAGAVTGALYELFQIVFKMRQDAGLTKKVQNSTPVQNSPKVSNGPSPDSPQNTDGIYEVPYKNENNKQAKPSPQLDHEYAEPIKPSAKNGPHYKVPAVSPQPALPTSEIADNNREEATTYDKPASDVSRSSPLLSPLKSFDKEPDQVSQASIPDSPFPARDNSNTFFSPSVFDTAPSDSGKADTVSVASSADISMFRSDSVSSGSSETPSSHSRSNSLLNQTATTEGAQPGFATTFDDATNVGPSLAIETEGSGKMPERESQGNFSVTFPSFGGEEEPEEKEKAEVPTAQETAGSNSDLFVSPASFSDPFASSTNEDERTQPVAGEGFFTESFAAFDSAFGDFDGKNSDGDNQVNDNLSTNDPFASSDVGLEEPNASENVKSFTSETSFEAAFSSEKFTPSQFNADAMQDDSHSGASEQPVEEKSEPIENSSVSFLWDNAFEETENVFQPDVAQTHVEDKSHLPENSTMSSSWDNAFGETESESQPVTTQSAAASETVQFSWTESFTSDDFDVTGKSAVPSTSAAVSWDDAFGAAPATNESSDQNTFSWDDTFGGNTADSVNAQFDSSPFGDGFASSSTVESASDKPGVPDFDAQSALQPTGRDNPPVFDDSAFVTSSSSEIAESNADSEETKEDPAPAKDPFDDFKISFPAPALKPEIFTPGESADSLESEINTASVELSAAKENESNEVHYENIKDSIDLEETDKTLNQAKDHELESSDIEEEQMKEERPSELQIQESKFSLSERPISPTAPPPLPPRPVVSAPPLPARPSSSLSSSTVSPGRSPMRPQLSTESPHGKKGSAKKTPPPPPPRVDLNEKSQGVSSKEKDAFPDPFGADLFDNQFGNSNGIGQVGNSDWTATWPSTPELPPKEKSKDSSDPFNDSFFTDFHFPQKTVNDNLDPFATTNPSSEPFPAAFGNEDLFPAFTPAKNGVSFGGGDPFQNDSSNSFSAFPTDDPFSDISDPFADRGILSDDPFGDSATKPHVAKSLTLNESLVASDEADSFA